MEARAARHLQQRLSKLQQPQASFNQHFNGGAGSWDAGKPFVAGDQGRAEGFGEREGGGIVGRAVGPQLPYSVQQTIVRIAGNPKREVIRDRLAGAGLREFPGHDEPPKHVRYFHVENVRGGNRFARA